MVFNMNSLLIYDSSSDDEIDNRTVTQCQSVRAACNLGLSPNNQSADYHDKKSSSFDFFGVLNDSSDSEGDSFSIYDKPEISVLGQPKIVERLNETTETPKTPFWTNEEVDIQGLREEGDIWQRDVVGEEIKDSENAVVIKKVIRYSQNELHGKQLNCKKYKRKIQDSTTGQIKCERKSPFSETKSHLPLFAVHSKIALHLNSNIRSSFAFPRRKHIDLSTNSAILNKIVWSCPQYSHLLATASSDGSTKIWHCLNNQAHCVKNIVKHSKSVKDVSWSYSGKILLSAGYDKTALVTDIETGETVAQCPHTDFVTTARFHPIDHHSFITGSKNVLLRWDKRNTSKATVVYKYKDTFGQVQDLAFNSDGSEMFTCNDLVSRDSSDRNIMAWDIRKGVVVSNQIYQERYTCVKLKVHPTDAEFYAQSQGGYIALFSSIRPYKMNKCKRYEGHKVAGYSIGFDIAPSGNFIASGSADGNIAIYDTYRSKRIHQLNMGKDSVVVDVAWHPVLSGVLAACTWDGRLAIWNP